MMDVGNNLEGRQISAPASIANLGPGLDALALAVDLYTRVRIRKVDRSDCNQLLFRFLNVRLEGENLIETAFRHLAMGREFPSMELEVESEIPLRAGLGSSAAAIAVGFRLFEAVLGSLPLSALLAAGCELEGHPENVAAALLGGFVTCCQKDGGGILAFRGAWPRSLRIIIATPNLQLATHHSRAILPSQVPLSNAVGNIQRVALFLQALHLGDFTALSEALRDRLHQPARSALVPGLERLLSVQHPDLLGVFLSGSGPSVGAFAERNLEEISALLAHTFHDAGVRCETRILAVHTNTCN